MDYEQKYNKLVNAIKVLQETNPSDIGIRNWVNDNVSELRESEDEKMRKGIIQTLKRYAKCVEEEHDASSAKDFLIKDTEKQIAWLEKQKPEVNVVKFKQDNIEDLTDFEKAFQGMCCDKNKQFAKECCKTLLELAKKQLQEKCDKQCCGEVNDIAMQQQLQIWFDKGKCSGIDEVIFHPETYGLQKQGEQKSTDNAEAKFNIGDWVIWDNKVICYIDSVYQGKETLMYTITDTNGMIRSYAVKSFEKNARLWTIQDAKPGDVLACNEEILLFKSYSVQGRISLYCWYNGHTNNFHSKEVVDTLMTTRNKVCPATKEQRDLLFQKMHEAGYEWDAENKELNKFDDEEYNGEDYGIDSLYHAQRILEKTLGKVNGYQTDDGILSHQCAITAVKKLYEQKPTEWSEEDEHRINRISDFIWKNRKGDTDEIYQQEQDVDWLKSLKQRYTWKPSREQMIALRQVISGCSYDIEPLLELEAKLKEF